MSAEQKLFLKMLNDCQKYSLAINARGGPFPTEPIQRILFCYSLCLLDEARLM